MSLDNYSNEELKEELEKRTDPLRLNRQKLNDKEVVDKIYKCVFSILEKACGEEYWDEDNDHYIFEAVMIAFHGPDYFRDFHNTVFG